MTQVTENKGRWYSLLVTSSGGLMLEVGRWRRRRTESKGARLKVEAAATKFGGMARHEHEK
jgi:hypothetical protein